MVDISFIILTWNSRLFLKKCFNSIIKKCQHEDLSFEIIVIDNGSTDGSEILFSNFFNKYPHVFKIEYLGRNTGTTYSRNIGIKKSTGRYLCILDSDTEFREGSLREIFYQLSEDDSIGLIVPRLMLPDGSTQNSVKRFPTFGQKLLKIPQAVFGVQVTNKDFYPNFPFHEKTEVDTAISACWFMSREIVDQVGYLDEQIFYSPEDLDYCVRIRKAGCKVIYLPTFTVLHDTQQISHKRPFSKVSRSHFWGLVYYFRKHGGWFSNHHLPQ